eukprot:756680-Hanusia_phi.AAC.1
MIDCYLHGMLKYFNTKPQESGRLPGQAETRSRGLLAPRLSAHAAPGRRIVECKSPKRQHPLSSRGG